MKIVVCDRFRPRALRFYSNGRNSMLSCAETAVRSELLPIVADATALVVRSETKSPRMSSRRRSSLRVVGRAGVGVDNVDIEAATQHGTVVMNTPGGNTVTTAELSFTMLLSLARKVPQAHATMVAGKWDRKLFQGVELAEKRLGVLGMGRIGTESPNVRLPSECASWLMIRIYGRPRKGHRAEFARKWTMFIARRIFITFTCRLTKETKEMLNAAAFAKMKPGVKIVNCAARRNHFEADLIAALESGKVAGAALDVFAVEPLPADHPYRKQANLILTPHLGASTEEAQEKCGIEVAEVIAGYLLTGEVRNAVNLPYLDAKTYEQVKPYLPLGEALGKLLAQLAPSSADRLHINLRRQRRLLPNIDPVSRAILRAFCPPAI